MGSDISPDDAEFFESLLLKKHLNRVPTDGSFELTHRCNLKCVHCYLGDQESIRKHHRSELDTAAVKRILDELAESGIMHLTFTGGDPMVRKDFIEIYVYAIKLGILVTVFCDGILINDKVIETFRKYPPREVEVSIYGASAKTYESVTQIKGSYPRFLRGLDRLKDNAIHYRLKTVLLTVNQHEFDAMEAIASERGVKFHHDAAVFPCLPHNDNGNASNAAKINSDKATVTVDLGSIKKYELSEPVNLRVAPEEVVAIDLSSHEKRELWKHAQEHPPQLENNRQLYTCGAAKTTFHIDPYGVLLPCILMSSHGHDLKTSSFMQGWNGPLNEINSQLASPDRSCNTCEIKALCMGCPAIFAAETGAPDVKSDYICRTTHERYARLKPYLDKTTGEAI